MEASEPKWVNLNDILYEVNSVRLGGLCIRIQTFETIYLSYVCLLLNVDTYLQFIITIELFYNREI